MEKKVSSLLVASILVVAVFSTEKVSAAEKTVLQESVVATTATTTWVQLGTGVCTGSVTYLTLGLLFSGLSLGTMALSGGAAIAAGIGSFTVSTAISTAGLTDNSKIVFTQYRSSGAINSNTIIKTVADYYIQKTDGTYKYIKSNTTTTTLGDIYNTYSIDSSELAMVE
ncbi:hypothetical protein [Konateibacter massiliensis]|uniref:hypothetical protein n=1 Tax=Konateibacter massiliensis TaxID=2002841 RepID=UPI000C15DC35|nr:hypothetical protein [Konateibacter massiliensis]